MKTTEAKTEWPLAIVESPHRGDAQVWLCSDYNALSNATYREAGDNYDWGFLKVNIEKNNEGEIVNCETREATVSELLEVLGHDLSACHAYTMSEAVKRFKYLESLGYSIVRGCSIAQIHNGLSELRGLRDLLESEGAFETAEEIEA